MIEKFGRTLLFVIFLLIFILGAKMAIRVSLPGIRKLSPSLADTLATV